MWPDTDVLGLFNLDLLLIFLILYGIPFLIVLLLGSWGLKKAGKDQWAKWMRKYLLIGFSLFTIGLMIYDWVDRNHVRSFPLDEKHEIRLHIEEIDSFLDQPTAFTLTIIDPNGKKGTFSFQTGDGSHLRFHKSEKYSIIWIEGFEDFEGGGWFLDYEGNEIHKSNIRDFEKDVNFELFAELGFNLVLEEK